MGRRVARGLGFALRRLPRESGLRLAGASGRAWVRLGGPRTDTARRNLRIAFPDWRETERRDVAERSFANLGRSFVEFCIQGRLDDAALRALADVEGLENLEAARSASPTGGVICLTGHCGSWELLLNLMAAHGIPISVVQRPRDNPVLDHLVSYLRARPGIELLPRGSAARGALRALRAGKVLAMTLDQNAPREEGIFVPFFGRLASTRDGPARIAMRTGAPILPAFIERIGDGGRHRVRVLPHFQVESGEDDPEAAVQANVARMSAEIEAAVRRAPDQWVWTHRRWRTQPLGEPRPYPSSRRRTLGEL